MEDTTMKFQSTLPIQGETKRDRVFYRLLRISILTSLPIQGETSDWEALEKIATFQSTLPIQGETFFPSSGIQALVISIHSPYTGRDVRIADFLTISFEFQSTLPIQGETDTWARFLHSYAFQSTLPIQGETRPNGRTNTQRNISIHSPYTGRDDGWSRHAAAPAGISIHSPYTGRD